MTKTAKIIDLKQDMSEEDLILAGTDDQVMLIKSETGQPDTEAFFNTVEEAEVAKGEWVNTQ